MADTLSVHLPDVLYRTRGHDWDYAFLLQPDPLIGEGWYTLYRRIFANVEPGPTPVLLRGALGIGLGQPFFATAFTDAVRRDYQDRPIAHYIAWFGKAAEDAAGSSFGPGLVDCIAPALEDVFNLDPETLRRGETKPLDTLVRARFMAALPSREVCVTCSLGGSLHWLGTLAV
jgi:hypothetical protein